MRRLREREPPTTLSRFVAVALGAWWLLALAAAVLASRDPPAAIFFAFLAFPISLVGLGIGIALFVACCRASSGTKATVRKVALILAVPASLPAAYLVMWVGFELRWIHGSDLARQFGEQRALFGELEAFAKARFARSEGPELLEVDDLDQNDASADAVTLRDFARRLHLERLLLDREERTIDAVRWSVGMFADGVRMGFAWYADGPPDYALVVPSIDDYVRERDHFTVQQALADGWYLVREEW